MFYPTMALLLVSIAVIGFTPNSLAILAGTNASPPLIIHFHAAAMSTWLLLLLLQTVLVASGRVNLHRLTGLASLVVAPIVITLMVIIAASTFDADDHGIGAALNQARRIIILASFYVWAIVSRRRDSDTHKRCFSFLQLLSWMQPFFVCFGCPGLVLTTSPQRIFTSLCLCCRCSGSIWRHLAKYTKQI